MSRARIEIPQERIAELCRQRRIRWLALFGSVLRDDFRPESDVDVLVEFEPEQRYTYFTLAQIEDDLSLLLGRRLTCTCGNPFTPSSATRCWARPRRCMTEHDALERVLAGEPD
jgi:predicted nucleotidyltransferase